MLFSNNYKLGRLYKKIDNYEMIIAFNKRSIKQFKGKIKETKKMINELNDKLEDEKNEWNNICRFKILW